MYLYIYFLITRKIYQIYQNWRNYLRWSEIKYMKAIYVCIYLIPPPRARCDAKSIFKRSTDGLNTDDDYLIEITLWCFRNIHIYRPPIFMRSLTGLNSEFSFSKTSCLTKAEEPSLPYYFTHSWRENNWIHTFPKGISAMWNAISLVQDLKITPQSALLFYITPSLPYYFTHSWRENNWIHTFPKGISTM